MNPDPFVSSVAGMVAGIVKCTISHPFNTWKVYEQIGKRPPLCIRRLYKGIHAPMGRNALEHSTHMGFRDITAIMTGIDNPFLIGLLSGIPQALTMAPMDYACTRLQLSQPVVWSQCLRGLPWIVGKEMIGGMTFFGIYEGTKKLGGGEGDGHWAGVRGSIAALSAMVVSYPIDTIKTRHQAAVACATKGCLSAGLRVSILKCIVSNYVTMMVFEKTKGMLMC